MASHKKLAQENPHEITWRMILLTVIGTLLLTLLGNAVAITYLAKYHRNIGTLLTNKKWAMANDPQLSADCLILGDSTGNQGIDPDIIQSEMNQSAINLCAVGYMLSLNDVWVLERYLEKHKAPKSIIITHAYDVWQREPDNSLLLRVPLSWQEIQSLTPKLNLTTKDYFGFQLEHNLPIYSQNNSLSEALQFPWQAFKQKWEIKANGFMIEKQANPSRVLSDTKRHLEFVSQNTFTLSEANRQALDRLVELTNQHNWHVYLVNAPIHNGLYQDADLQKYYADLQKILGETAARSPMIHYILQEPMTFEADQMANADHVTLEGATSYTKKICQIINNLKTNK